MPSPTPTTTRERLVAAMTDALRRRGLHGIGLNELLQQAGAPKGVLYHHFPGGKTELAIAAIDDVVNRMLAGLDKLLLATPDPIEATRRWMAGATVRLSETGFESGCPLATVALETTPDDPVLRDALARDESPPQVLEAAGKRALWVFEGIVLVCAVRLERRGRSRPVGKALRLRLSAQGRLPLGKKVSCCCGWQGVERGETHALHLPRQSRG